MAVLKHSKADPYRLTKYTVGHYGKPRKKFLDPAEIFVSLLVMAKVLVDWRVVNVVPSFKKGCKLLPNIRGGKVTGESLCDKIYLHLERQELIMDSQCDFVHGE